MRSARDARGSPLEQRTILADDAFHTVRSTSRAERAVTIFIAEDDHVSRRLLKALLESWGHEVRSASDGAEAWEMLSAQREPLVAVLDWMLPGLDGTEICRRIRREPALRGSYVILLTAKAASSAAEGLESGADDFLAKPFDRLELRARLRAGLRVLGLQRELADRVRELERALGAVDRLEGLLPICCVCKRIRDGEQYWRQVEDYVSAHSAARFSHGLCPECLESEVLKLDPERALGA
jgi:sigma-B regulation protein RsbU (phosphoserine phosphatase)